MALNTNPFIEGIDPTSTFGGYASVLLQLVREAYPSSTYGMILYDTTAPDVTGSNAWRKTCIWINLTLPNTPVISVYKEGTSPGWANITSIIADGSIRTSMIADYNPSIINTGVTLPKLSPAGGTASQLIRVNATATAFEFVSLAGLVIPGSIPIGSLITTGIPPGQMRYAGVIGPGTATWYTPIQIINNLPDSSIGTDLLGVPGVLTGRSQFLTARTTDTFAAYRYFEPNVDILDTTLSGAKLQIGTVYSDRINTTAIANGSYLRVTAGVAAWDPAPTTGITTKFVTDLATLGPIPVAAASSQILAHTLAQVPTSFRVSFICVNLVGSIGYNFQDEVDAMTVTELFGGDFRTAFTYSIGNAGIRLIRNWGGTLYIADKGTGIASVLLPADWRLRLYATYTS